MPLGSNRPYELGLSPGNQLELMAGGASFYPRIEADIKAARHEVLLGTYLWEPDTTGRHFLDLARRAALRGLRVCVLLDGIGSRRVDIEDIEAIRAAGGEVAMYHPLRFPLFESRLLRRFHRKLLVLDGVVAYTGGAGFGDGWAAQPPTQWWDLMARVTGPVLPKLRQIFAADWKRAAHHPLPELDGPPPRPAGGETLHPLVTHHSQPELRRRLKQAVNGASRRVDIANAYFVPTLLLRSALKKAARRGVEVRLLLPGRRTDHFAVWSAGRRHFQTLLKSGVRIFEFQRSMLHSKYAVVDDEWGYIGSSNLDNWSGRFNLELDLGVSSPRGVAGLSARFEEDLTQCREIRLAQWAARPLSLRIAETFFGWFDPLL